MSIKYAGLGILAEGSLHGHELKINFDDKVGELWSLNYGQIYSTILSQDLSIRRDVS